MGFTTPTNTLILFAHYSRFLQFQAVSVKDPSEEEVATSMIFATREQRSEWAHSIDAVLIGVPLLFIIAKISGRSGRKPAK